MSDEIELPSGIYLNIKAAGELLNKTPQNVQYYIKHCNLKARKIGSQWILNKEDVMTFKPPKVGRPTIYKKRI